ETQLVLDAVRAGDRGKRNPALIPGRRIHAYSACSAAPSAGASLDSPDSAAASAGSGEPSVDGAASSAPSAGSCADSPSVDGCAPTLSQCEIRSASSVTRSGESFASSGL